MLSHSDGVLSAATAFGKTVVCSYLIAERKVNTLILLQSKDLLNQWVDELINSYGMVIMDECHHAASNTSMELLQKINAKYVYGVSATPKRGDSLDRIIYMLLGPLRHRFTALERVQEQGIGHYFVPYKSG